MYIAQYNVTYDSIIYRNINTTVVVNGVQRLLDDNINNDPTVLTD